jgi:hypothetical protein
VNGNKKEKLLTVNFTLILISSLNDKFLTVYDKYVAILTTAMYFATCMSSVCLMHPPSFFCTLAIHVTPQTEMEQIREEEELNSACQIQTAISR